MLQELHKKTILVIVLILIAAMTRLIPHPPNFTPIGTMALMGGAYLGRKWMAILIPLLALYLSDIILNHFVLSQFFTSSTGSPFFANYMIPVYGSIILIAWIGIKYLKKINLKSVFLSALAASAAFYLITNFGVWLAGSGYPKTIGGLLQCMVAGWPFFKFTIAGNLFYSAVLFGLVEWLSRHYFRIHTQVD